jgi:tetratricopeptide (TPR) repeat protein
LLRKFLNHPQLNLFSLVKDFVPHLEEVAENLTDALTDDDLVVPFIGVSRFYEAQGLYALAEAWDQQCLLVTTKLLGQDHPRVAQSLNNLASLYNFQARYTEAEPLFVQALELNKRLLGQDHLDVATSLNNLASLYRNQGRYAEAEPLYMQALELRKRWLGQKHPTHAV